MQYKAIFKPVNNSQGFDVREFELIDGKPSTYRWIHISDERNLSKLPILTPLKKCESREQYNSQFSIFSS